MARRDVDVAACTGCQARVRRPSASIRRHAAATERWVAFQRIRVVLITELYFENLKMLNTDVMRVVVLRSDKFI